MQKYKYSMQIALGYAPDGKQIRKRIYANSKKDLQAQKARLQAEFADGCYIGDITFREYSERWFNAYKSNKAANTQRMYAEVLKLTTLIGSLSIKSITTTDLQNLINSNWEHAETCKKLNMTLKAIFKRALNDGIISRNPAADLEVPKVIKTEKRILTDAEREAVRQLISVEDRTLCAQDKMLLALLYHLGLRPEEARALMVSDFDFSAGGGGVTIARALAYSKMDVILKKTKTSNIRVLPLPDSFIPLLKSYLSTLPGIYLFQRSDGGMLTKSVYVRMWGRIKNAINEKLGGTRTLNVVSDIVPYTFRVSYATNLYYSGITLLKASQLMGHSDTKMILSVYAKIDADRENLDALRKII